ncbi:hypothetical protein F5887DRAFT_173590 [Amanita rubescens]|nr:hypothetical protein F5887DRAFT_173590 [Amanita rubescens]
MGPPLQTRRSSQLNLFMIICAVALIRVSLKVYIVSNPGSRPRKLYQIYADRIKIVMPSAEPVDVRTKRVLYDVT